MAQFPAPGPTWSVLSGSQFLDVGVSTALTIPAIPANTSGSYEYVAIIRAQGAGQWIRLDGGAASAAYSAGEFMAAGDWVIVYGINNIKAVRVIHDQAGGSLAVDYYYYARDGAIR